MSNITSIAKSRDTEADPLRAALAAAIDKEGEARGVLDRAEQALQRGRDVVASAEGELDRAKKLVTAAQDRDGRATAARIRSKSADASPDASATRHARARVVECGDAVEVSAAAIERLTQDAEEAATAAKWAENSRIVAVNNILARHAELLLADAVAARLRLRSAEAALSEILNTDRGPEFPEDTGASIRARDERTAELLARRKDVSAFFLSRRTEAESEAESAAVAAIRAFSVRLLADPSAEFPALP